MNNKLTYYGHAAWGLETGGYRLLIGLGYLFIGLA